MRKLRNQILTYFISISSVYCQNGGIKANLEISKNERINNAIGRGIYYNIDKYSGRFEMLFSIDINKNRQSFASNSNHPTTEKFESKYKHINASLAPMYSIPLTSKIKFKAGISLIYNLMSVNDEERYNAWFQNYSDYSLGNGLIANLSCKELSGTLLNFDLFIIPQYSFSFRSYSYPDMVKPEFKGDFLILNIQIGLSYSISDR